jgi:Uma2 family endonuclease
MSAVVEKPCTNLEPRRKLWSLPEFQALSDHGHFLDQRVELLAGEIYVMPRQDFVHSFALTKLYEFCRELFDQQYWVRYQLPLHLGGDSYLEPDVSIVTGKLEDYQDHPETALFVAEVSNHTLRHDRRKLSLYARAGIPEFWIVDLNARRIEVHRGSREDASQPYGFGYLPPTLHPAGDSVATLLRHDRPIDVIRLFPLGSTTTAPSPAESAS